MAVLLSEHLHHERAKRWWSEEESGAICFIRVTQISVLRLLTTSSVMNGKPLTAKTAWKTYERLFVDDRVSFMPEHPEVDQLFRTYSSESMASPKMWADSWLLAAAATHEGRIVTLDAALTARGNSLRKQLCTLL
jgi:toxin-antitoxin system PIN domain toxin